ncbi:threonine/serine exporter family protein [Solibacillus sp. A46]|uniref:Threonine/serine exporter family protein n=1 Tax=Solibacillus faecavium TaxID=2762221 RepID=A0ABR8Y1S6_9BACL|nr:threonine/serine exporter family protein [Solibacillus faecavium]MBD8038152.1 threonine/serine exporter family protein [Solibacillus faecavium]
MLDSVLIQIVISFVATACFGVIFNAPTKTIPACGFVGAVGWAIYYVMIEIGVDEVQASFLGAFVVSLVAYFFARKFRMPMIIFSVSGIIPLVPGGIAYNTMRNVMELDYIMGLQNGMRAFMISGAIAMGLVFAEVFMQIIFRLLSQGKTSMQSFMKSKKRSS